MSDFTYDPPVSEADNLLQSIVLNVDGKRVAAARWHAARGNGDGVVQILDFDVEPPYRRRGHGKRLMIALVGQLQEYHRRRRMPLRRVWVGLRQKTHIVGRAFFAQHGFSHVATVKDLLTDEDLLIYMRTFN